MAKIMNPRELILALDDSGTGEDALRYMHGIVDAEPQITTEELVERLTDECKAGLAANDMVRVTPGTLNKIPLVLAGKPIPVPTSRISAAMKINPQAILQGQPQNNEPLLPVISKMMDRLEEMGKQQPPPQTQALNELNYGPGAPKSEQAPAIGPVEKRK